MWKQCKAFCYLTNLVEERMNIWNTEKNGMACCIQWATNFSVFLTVVCVNAFEKRSESKKKFCYFWFFIKYFRIFFIKYMIEYKFYQIGKRWQWIPCESFEFRRENWPLKKYVVFQYTHSSFFFSHSLLWAAAVLSSSYFLYYTASAAVFFLRIQRTLVHTIHLLLFRSICTRVRH